MALAVAFFVVLPLQYYLVWIDWYGLYSVFIPVYVFLLLATIAALRQDTKNFMGRVAETQWGLMSQDRAGTLSVEDGRGIPRRRGERNRTRRALMVDHAILTVAGGRHRAVDQPHGIFRGPRHVGDQARSRRQGLGLDDRGAWRGARPARFGDFRSARVLSHDALLLDRVTRSGRMAEANGASFSHAQLRYSDPRHVKAAI
jgi:hypothetical protein